MEYEFCPNREDENHCPQYGGPCRHPSGDCPDRHARLVRPEFRGLVAASQVSEPKEESGRITSHAQIIRKIVQAGVAKGMPVPE